MPWSLPTQKLINNAVVIALLAIGLIYVCSRFLHLGNVEYTDNAQVKQHITPVNTRVQGFIKKICFEEYKPVHKGDTLLVIEDAEFKLRLNGNDIRSCWRKMPSPGNNMTRFKRSMKPPMPATSRCCG